MLLRTTALLLLALVATVGCSIKVSGKAGEPGAPGAQASQSGAPEAAPEVIRLMTWNLQNFTDEYDDPYIDSRLDDEGPSKDADAIHKIGEILRLADADVVALQEIESDRAALALLDAQWPEHGYRYFAGTPSMGWHQNVVLASRLPILEITSFREREIENPLQDRSTNLFNNRLMGARIQAPSGYEFVVLFAHLKAGRSEENAVWRLAQLKVLDEHIDRLEEIDGDVNVAFAGDMNFLPGSEEDQAVLGMGFVDVFPEDQAVMTHPARELRSQLDYVFLNDAMAHEMVEGSAQVFVPFSLEEMAQVSDHLPVLVEFLALDED